MSVAMIYTVYHAGGRSVTAGVERAEVREPSLGEGLRELLDHIAVELAEEYVRLMEAAAENEARCAGTRPMAPPRKAGGGR
jgi:hypothetical protein